MKGKRRFRSPALQYTYDRFIAHDPKLVEQYEEEVINAEIESAGLVGEMEEIARAHAS